MPEGLNRVLLLGNLCADPDLRFTQGGQAVLNIRMATNESWFDKQANERKERTEFHSVVVWGKRGEALAKFLAKGAAVFVEGSLRTSDYQDREGNKRFKTEIIASNVILTGDRGTHHEQGVPPARANGGHHDRQGPKTPNPHAAPPPPDDDGGYLAGDDAF